MRKFIKEMFDEGLITMYQANQIHKYFLKKPPPEFNMNISIAERKEIARDIIFKHYGVSWQNVVSTKRNVEYTKPRHTYMYVCAEWFNQGLVRIAKELHRLDHTTVINGRDKIKKLIDEDDEETMNVLNKLKNELQKFTITT